ncbi:MbtH family protein [Streptomyces adustus]|uniref:MbtH family protein n=1 Tax=Streptomyces adustus TaxID=1609272 RepID=UPI0035D7408A
MNGTATQEWTVVVNDEEQYSLWASGRDVPAGWRTAGVSGTREECLSHIDQVWTDMRPLSLRRAMDSGR